VNKGAGLWKDLDDLMNVAIDLSGVHNH